MRDSRLPAGDNRGDNRSATSRQAQPLVVSQKSRKATPTNASSMAGAALLAKTDVFGPLPNSLPELLRRVLQALAERLHADSI